MDPYRAALLDWLACAYAGSRERAALAAREAADGVLGRIAYAGTAGHVLDFDDTFLPGLSHLSAATAPVALVLGAARGVGTDAVVDAYAAGFEAMGAFSEASHPALYDGGWHPTAVCGTVGAAVVASRILGLDPDSERVAVRLALLRASGLRAAFGSDGKSLQVGLAAAAGAHAAQMAAGGAEVGETASGAASFEQAFGASWAEPPPGTRDAAKRNWIKAYPCCLKAHSSIEAAAAGPADGPVTVRVHPRARQAAFYDDVENGLQAKFSIPYLVAYTRLHGPPRDPAAFDSLDPAARSRLGEVTIETDDSLGDAEAVLFAGGEEVARVPAATGSPENPMSDEELDQKVETLAGDRLEGVLDDEPERTLERAGL